MANNTGKLAGRTVFITGGSRGIGKAIALKVARDGANVVIAAKTAEPHPKLPGTIYSACKEVEEAGGKGLPCVVDVRDEKQVSGAVEEAVKKFGGIDIVVNNASAISLTGTADTDMKRYDLMHNINTRGTFLVTKACLPYLKKSPHPHVLNISPPLNLSPKWFKDHVAYTTAKYGMSMCVLGMHEEFRPFGIGVNALWPRTVIYTAALKMLRGPDSSKHSRKPEIMADAAYAILTQDPKTVTGNFFLDEGVLGQHGVTDFDHYACDPAFKDQLRIDGFVETDEEQKTGGRIAAMFEAVAENVRPETVRKTQAVFQFVVTGNEAGKWFLDLKNGSGSCGPGKSPSPPDAILTIDSDNLFKMFTGKLKPATAFMSKKMKIDGDMQIVLKLEGLMSSIRSKL